MNKNKFIIIFLSTILVLLFLGFYDYSSYSRKIGDTRFYLVETMAISKDGKPLVGLYYKPTSESGFIGEKTPGFPKKNLLEQQIPHC